MNRDALPAVFAEEQREAVLQARLKNIQHLVEEPELLGDRRINPGDVLAARWSMEMGRLPSEVELHQLGLGKWPVLPTA